METFLKAFEFSQKMKIPFYIVDDYNLEDYTTTKKNLKQNQSNIPDAREVEMVKMSFSVYHKRFKESKKKQFVEMFFNKDKEKTLRPSSFKLVKVFTIPFSFLFHTPLDSRRRRFWLSPCCEKQKNKPTIRHEKDDKIANHRCELC